MNRFLHEGDVAVVEVSYVTAKNLFRPEDLPPHSKLTVAALGKARDQMSEIRISVKDILDYAIKGSEDLRGGNCWSSNIDMFETISMEQARNLATFPIGINHPKLGPRVFHARAAFVAFREAVRWEVVGKIFSDTSESDYNEALDLIAEHAKQVNESMLRIEKALEKLIS
jgi:hypothetical protein